MTNLDCFKAYDISGRIPDELNEDMAYRIGQAYARFLAPGKVVIGRDIRLSSAVLCESLSKGLTDAGVDVYDIGLCGTEEIYFATFSEEMDGGIMVTASHNPAGQKHRLENPGLVEVVIVEIQSGDYLGEDDIVRFDDKYGRVLA